MSKDKTITFRASKQDLERMELIRDYMKKQALEFDTDIDISTYLIIHKSIAVYYDFCKSHSFK